MGKSQIPILHKNLKFIILKSQISQIQASNPNLKTQNSNQIPMFPQVHKYELRSVQQKGTSYLSVSVTVSATG